MNSTTNVQKSCVTYWLIPSNEASLETFPLSVLTPRWEKKIKRTVILSQTHVFKI